MRKMQRKTRTQVGGTVALMVMALGATGAVAQGFGPRSHDPREAVPLEEVVQVSRDATLATDTGGCGCGILGSLLGGLLGTVTGGGLLGSVTGGGILGAILGGTGGTGGTCGG